MKSKILILFVICYCLNSSAAVYTVSTVLNAPAQFNDIATALNTANAGDTIYVSPPYNNTAVTITKSITLIAQGNRADVEFPVLTSVSDFILNNGVNNVSINGFTVNANISLGVNNYNVSVSNCYIQGYIALNDTASNIVISNNIFAGATNIASVDIAIPAPRNAIFNVIIQNNIFNGTIWGLSAPSSIIQNNIFLNTSFGAFRNISACGLCAHYYIENALIYNNIFYRANPIAEVGASCTYKNNITYNPGSSFTTLPGTGNLDNTDPLFINFPAAGALFDWNHNYNLQVSSPGINAGTDGLNIGREGGNNSGSLHGETIGIPVIRRMQVQNFNAPQNGNINVKVRSTKAR